jgi:hypothetical protein
LEQIVITELVIKHYMYGVNSPEDDEESELKIIKKSKVGLMLNVVTDTVIGLNTLSLLLLLVFVSYHTQIYVSLRSIGQVKSD